MSPVPSEPPLENRHQSWPPHKHELTPTEESSAIRGPQTERGKAVSRLNGLKHGLTGAGVALPGEDQEAIEIEFVAMQDDFNPSTSRSQKLLRRAAFLNNRLERIERYLKAHAGYRMRHARDRFIDQRMTSVEALAARTNQETVTTAVSSR